MSIYTLEPQGSCMLAPNLSREIAFFFDLAYQEAEFGFTRALLYPYTRLPSGKSLPQVIAQRLSTSLWDNPSAFQIVAFL